ASGINIKIASLHAKNMGLEINYLHTSAEELATEGAQYDVVLALEIIEHVVNIDNFVASCAKLVKPGGLLIFSTINRTVKSFMLAIIGAEYIMRWLPRGTHEWRKFVTPAELTSHIRINKLVVKNMTGMEYNVLHGSWKLSQNIDVN